MVRLFKFVFKSKRRKFRLEPKFRLDFDLVKKSWKFVENKK